MWWVYALLCVLGSKWVQCRLSCPHKDEAFSAAPWGLQGFDSWLVAVKSDKTFTFLQSGSNRKPVLTSYHVKPQLWKFYWTFISERSKHAAQLLYVHLYSIRYSFSIISFILVCANRVSFFFFSWESNSNSVVYILSPRDSWGDLNR